MTIGGHILTVLIFAGIGVIAAFGVLVLWPLISFLHKLGEKHDKDGFDKYNK